MAKDRAAPFSRKHMRYWIPVTGGMLLIGAINVLLGVCSYTAPPSEAPQRIEPVLPAPYAPVDAGALRIDAAAPPTPPSP